MSLKNLAVMFGLAAAFGGNSITRIGAPSVTRNGGTATGAAAAKRAKRRRRNIAKNPRGAA